MLRSCCSKLGKAGLLSNMKEEGRQLLSQGSAEGHPPGERWVFKRSEAHVLLEAGQLVFLLQTRDALAASVEGKHDAQQRTELQQTRLMAVNAVFGIL